MQKLGGKNDTRLAIEPTFESSLARLKHPSGARIILELESKLIGFRDVFLDFSLLKS